MEYAHTKDAGCERKTIHFTRNGKFVAIDSLSKTGENKKKIENSSLGFNLMVERFLSLLFSFQ